MKKFIFGFLTGLVLAVLSVSVGFSEHHEIKKHYVVKSAKTFVSVSLNIDPSTDWPAISDAEYLQISYGLEYKPVEYIIFNNKPLGNSISNIVRCRNNC